MQAQQVSQMNGVNNRVTEFSHDLCSEQTHQNKKVDVWLCRTDAFSMVEELLPFLSTPEQMRAQALRRQSAQLSYVVVHALLRYLLSHVWGCQPPEAFEQGLYGKPSIKGAPLHFSLSHTDGLVAVAIGHVPVGVDVESRLVDNPLTLAQACFAEAELLALRESDDPARMFRHYWCMKEAVVKATGAGMSQPLNAFSVPSDAASENAWCSVQLPSGQHVCVRPVAVPAMWNAAVAVMQASSELLDSLAFKAHWIEGKALADDLKCDATLTHNI